MRATLKILSLGVAALCSVTARAADPQPYRVDIAATGNGAMDATLHDTSDLVSLRGSAPVSPFGLIARARGELDRFKTVLESYGYYEAVTAISIDGLALNAPGLADTLSAQPKGHTARVAVGFTLGPLYHLRAVTIDELPESAARALALKEGAAAVAADVLAAGDRVRAALLEHGYAFADVEAPVAYQDKTQPLLDVSFHVTTGPRVNIGEIRIEGLERLHERVVRRRLTLHTGQIYSSTAIDAARRDLLKIAPLAAVSVRVGKALDATGGVPVTFVLRERKRHAVALNGMYSSDLGGSGSVTWTDRNLFGNAEQLSLSAALINLGGSGATKLGYDSNARYTLPDFGHRDQSLQFSLEAIKQYLDAYDQTAATAGVALSRRLSNVWSASAGVRAEREEIYQDAVTYHYTLVSLPLNLSYDSTHLASPLEDPTHGMRDSLSIAPTLSLGSTVTTGGAADARTTANPRATFVVTQLKLATYFDFNVFGFGAPGRSVLAGLLQAGEAKGAGEYSLPPDQRFYAGGSGTIRGYPYQSVGPIFAGTQIPVGGTALIAGSLEFRQRFGASWGAAVFVDAGQVSASLQQLDSRLAIGIGAGVRFYTAIGPVRVDLAVPTREALGGQAFQVYIGLGQAF